MPETKRATSTQLCCNGRRGTNEATKNKLSEAFHAYRCLSSAPRSEASCSASVGVTLLERRSLLRKQAFRRSSSRSPRPCQSDLLLALLGLLRFETRKRSAHVNKSKRNNILHTAKGCSTTTGFTMNGTSGCLCSLLWQEKKESDPQAARQEEQQSTNKAASTRLVLRDERRVLRFLRGAQCERWL